jgi:hypothetical protein
MLGGWLSVRLLRVLAVAVGVLACESDQSLKGVSITAPGDWLDAAVYIDRATVGTLQPEEKGVEEKSGLLIIHSVALNVPLDVNRIRAGMHEIKIMKSARPLILVSGHFEYPDTRGAAVIRLSIIGDSLQNVTQE